MSISSVVNYRKCMLCGACCSVCPKEAVSMNYNKSIGLYSPKVNKDKCTKCGLCEQVCPALNQSDSSIIGNHLKLFLGHSTNNSVRKYATSGGVINSLVRYLINENIVEAVLMVGKKNESPIEADVVIITSNNIDELLKEPRFYASRYVSVPVLDKLRYYKGKNIAVVGTPCQINALSKLAKFGYANVFRIGITCSGGMSYKATTEYKRKQKKPSKVDMFYRGDGWPGKNTLIDGCDKVEYNHLGSLFERMFSSQIFKNPGCRECRDHFAEMADVSFCDYWNQDEISREHIGNSVIIIRTSRADKVFSEMEKKGYIEIQQKLSEKEIINTQLKVIKYKKGNARYKYYFKIFWLLCDFIFYTKLYKFFGLKTYKKICGVYSSMCNKSNI